MGVNFIQRYRHLGPMGISMRESCFLLEHFFWKLLRISRPKTGLNLKTEPNFQKWKSERLEIHISEQSEMPSILLKRQIFYANIGYHKPFRVILAKYNN